MVVGLLLAQVAAGAGDSIRVASGSDINLDYLRLPARVPTTPLEKKTPCPVMERVHKPLRGPPTSEGSWYRLQPHLPLKNACPAQLRLAAASGIRASGAIRNVLGRQASSHGCQGSRGPSGPPTSPSSFCITRDLQPPASHRNGRIGLQPHLAQAGRVRSHCGHGCRWGTSKSYGRQSRDDYHRKLSARRWEGTADWHGKKEPTMSAPVSSPMIDGRQTS